MEKTISIVLADAQYLVRTGLKHILSNNDKYEIVGEANNEVQLLANLTKAKPDVVILDYNQPDSFNYDTISKLRDKHPETNIMIISADDNKQAIYQVLESGVNSFLTKTCDEEEIEDAVHATAKGEKFYCTRIIDYLLEKSFAKEEENCQPTPLTPREVEIVRLIAKGLIAKEIADVLSLSTHTIYTHRKKIMKKLKITSSSELILYALNNGLIEK